MMHFESRLDATMELLQTVVDDVTDLLLERYDDVSIKISIETSAPIEVMQRRHQARFL